MNIQIVSPAPPNSRRGNEITSLRWRQHLRALGHHVVVSNGQGPLEFDQTELLIALHADKSGSAIADFRAHYPKRPIWLMLTGTDIYRSRLSSVAKRSIQQATRLIALQDRAYQRVPGSHRHKLVVIKQSARAPNEKVPPQKGCFELSSIGHLRPVKDPFRAVSALRQLPLDSRIKLNHYGDALSEAMADRARVLTESMPRYHWRRSLPHRETLRRLSRSQATIISSRSEGGSAVISEAIACRTPVLATRIDGNVGLLGEDYSGYVPVGDAGELAKIMLRLEREPKYLEHLTQQIDGLHCSVDPQKERDSIAGLLG